jgi:hypothetical protein
MMGKKFWLAAIAAFIMYLVLGGIWYAWLMKDWYAANAPSGSMEPNMAWIVIGCLIVGLLFSWGYPRGYQGGAPMKEGMRYGIFFALVLSAYLFFEYAGGNFGMQVIWVTLIYEVIAGAIIGSVVGKIYGSAPRAA